MKKKLFIALVSISLLAAIIIFGSMAYADIEGELVIESASIESMSLGGFPKSGNLNSYEDVNFAKLPKYLTSNGEKTVEQVLYDGILSMEDEIDISKYKLTPDELHTLVTDFLNSYPEFFHCDNSYSYSYGSYVVAYYPSYIMDKDEYAAALEVYNAEIKKITDVAKTLPTDLEKLLYVHDYICANYQYDLSYTIYDAYNFIKNKTGVCQAYTLTLIGCYKELGIEVSWATSDAMNHIWNVVKLDGKYYHIDATWDDPISSETNPGKPFYARHNYFLLSDAEITNREHYNWISEYTCTSTTYDSVFWEDIRSPFVAAGGELYFLNNEKISLCKFDETTLSYESVLDIPDKWYANAAHNSYYSVVYSGLSYYNNLLYFNTQEKIVAFDPVTKNKLEFEVEGYEDMLFYSSYVDEGKIYLYGREDYYGEDFLFEEPFEKNFTVTWNYSSGTYEQEYMIGDIPSFEGNLDDIYVDDDFHDTFSNWDKAFTPLLNDTVFNAEYTPEEHSFEDDYCSCGLAFAPDVVYMDGVGFAGASVIYQSKMTIKLYVKAEMLEGADSMYTVVTREYRDDRESLVVNMTEYVQSGKYYVFYVRGIAAKEMNDAVNAVLHIEKDGIEYVYETYEYGISVYAKNRLNNPEATASEKTLLVDMLNYGSMAQLYFNYGTDALANSVLTEEQKEYASYKTGDEITLTSVYNYDKGSEDKTTIAGISGIFGDSVRLKFYLDLSTYVGEKENLSVRVSYTDVKGKMHEQIYNFSEMSVNEEYYTIAFDGIATKDMGIAITVEIYEYYGSESEALVSGVLTYSIETYAYNKQTSTKEYFSDLLKHMMAFSRSAEKYFTE